MDLVKHLTRADYEHVYEPSEDTFLLMDALESERAYLIERVKPRVAIEIGSGSGIVSAHLCQLLSTATEPLLCIATDLNGRASQASLRTAEQNQLTPYMQSVQTKFANGLERRLEGGVDVVVWNPPYVVTPSEELEQAVRCRRGEGGIALAWAGGVDGVEVINEFFESRTLNRMLSKKGVFYLVLINRNKPMEVMKRVDEKYGLQGVVVADRKAGGEHLFVLRFIRTII